MGGAASVKTVATIKEKECMLEISDQAKHLVSNGREVVFCERNHHVDCSKDTVFTDIPVQLQDQRIFELQLDGAAVLRVGLLTEKPEHHYFAQDAIFEVTDGFGPGLSRRKMYVNHIGSLCYGEPDAVRELLANYEDRSVYLYIVVVYGQPRLEATHGEKRIQWKTFEDSNIGLDGLGYQASCGLISSAEYFMLKEQLIPGHTYLLHWNMEHSKQAEANKEPEYGFIRVGIAAKGPVSLHNMSLDNPDIVWRTESAIASYPYSGTLAVLVNLSEEVEHNVLKISMGHTFKESLQVGTNTLDSLYMVVELNHGSMAVTHGVNICVLRPPGSIVHVKNYKDFPNQAALYFDIARHGWQPCKILFGADPTSFVVEFQEKLRQKDITMLTKNWTKNIKEISPTRSIQVEGTPEEFGEFELKLFFSRQDACGGDNIVSLRKDITLGKHWVITYETAEVARIVSSKFLYSIDGHQVTVLPYYEEIGCTVNKGNMPVIDREPFVVTTESIDGDKIRFVRNSELETMKFKQYVKSICGSSVDWLDNQVSDQDFVDEDEEDAIRVECEMLTSNYHRLLFWKRNARMAIMKYFTEEVKDSYLELDSTKWNTSLSLLENLVKSMNFEYIPDEKTKSVIIISSNTNIISSVGKELGKADSDIKQMSVTLSGVHAEKYIALDTENKINELAKRYRCTRFSMDTGRPEINISGPENEIQNIKIDLQKLMLLVTDVSIKISPECAQIANTVYEDLSNEFKQLGLNNRITIAREAIRVYTVIESEAEMKSKQEKMMQCVNFIIKEETVMVEDSTVDALWKTLKETYEQQGFIVKRGKNCLKVVCAAKNITQSTSVVQGLIAPMMYHPQKLYLSKDVAEFLAFYEFAEDINTGMYAFEQKDDTYTGTILIKDQNGEQYTNTNAIENAAKNVTSFWFIISKPWLASIIEHIPIERVAQKHSCLISADIGDSIASSGVSAVSVLTERNVSIHAKNGSVLECDVDALVTIVSPDLKATSSAAQTVMSAGGQPLHSECIDYVQKYGKLTEGGVALTRPGLLPCKGVIHSVMYPWKTRTEGSSLEILMREILQVAEREQYHSIAIPVLEFTQHKLQVETAVQDTLNCLKGYFATCKTSSIEGVFLCDITREGHDILQKKMKEWLNQSPWFTFVHGRLMFATVQFKIRRRLKLQYCQRSMYETPVDKENRNIFNVIQVMDSPYTQKRQRALSKQLSHLRFEDGSEIYIVNEGQRPVTARSRKDTSNPFSWGTQEGIPKRTIKWNVQHREEDSDEQGDIDQKDEADAPEPMPYIINLTENSRLHVVTGSIESQKVDVIVSTTIAFPELTGAVSKAIKRTGGDSILTECRQQNVRQLQCGQVVVTGSGKLSCKRLYHVLIDKSWTQNTYRTVHKSVKSCLEQATKFSSVSIAFPTFGTGLGKYPPDKVAEAMISSVQRFVAGNQVTSLKDIFIVVFYADAETIKIFEACVPGLLNEIVLKRKSPSSRGSNRQHIQKRSTFDQKASYKPPKDSSEHSDADDVLMVKVTSKNTVQSSQIRADIDQLIDEEYDTTEILITSEKDEEILSENEETLLRQLEKQHRVKVEIETKNRKVKISGLKKDVRKAEIKANDMLLRQFREMRIRKKVAEIVMEHVQWLYEETDGSKVQVSPEANFDIHMGYIGGKDFTYHNQAGDSKTVTEYKVIVGKLEEYPVNDSTKKRRLFQRNKEIEGIHLPIHWTIYGSDNEENQVVVPPNGNEFAEVKNKFLKDGCNPTKIQSITRIENRYMWLQYQSKKRQLDIQNPKDTVNERMLWHGTDANTYDIIIKKGFDRSFAGKNATLYGTGTYFATLSSYSNSYADRDQSGTQRMFLCKVLTGIHCIGKSGMGVLPTREVTQNQVVCYDSAANIQDSPSMFIIFHDTQAYPEYMIAYR